MEESKIKVENELKEITEKREAEQKVFQNMEETVYKHKERIDIPDKINGLASNLGIDLLSLESFMRGAKRLGYDAKAIGSMKMLQDLTFEMIM